MSDFIHLLQPDKSPLEKALAAEGVVMQKCEAPAWLNDKLEPVNIYHIVIGMRECVRRFTESELAEWLKVARRQYVAPPLVTLINEQGQVL